jgi:hypothetical protein
MYLMIFIKKLNNQITVYDKLYFFNIQSVGQKQKGRVGDGINVCREIG